MLKLFLITILVIFSGQVSAGFTLDDMYKLKNDKEVTITSFSYKNKNWIKAHYTNQEEIERYTNIFYETLLTFLNSEKFNCELRLIREIHERLKIEGIAETQAELEDYFKVLRVNHAIDDIFYEILSGANWDYFGLNNLNLEARGKTLRGHHALVEANNLKDLFAGFREFPDEENSCLYTQYNHIFNNIKNTDGKKTYSLKDFKRLTIKAFNEGIISRATYHKLRYLQTNSNVNNRDIWLNGYLGIIFNAKNKMIPHNTSYEPKDIELEDDFSTERIKRFSKLTRRKLLYSKYNETQIILLAQVLQKASRRMGVDADTETGKPYILQEFTILNPDGERENYVERIELDPQSQYNLARRLLRKDIVELQMMDIFVEQNITHEDVVMASLETGYISLEDLEFVVKYDDLWNPNKTRFEKVSGFVFTVAGYSTFLLPPPWNIAASIALGVVEGVVSSKHRNGAENDNPSTIIE